MAAGAVLIAAGLAIWASGRDTEKDSDLARRREIYAQLVPYPGSTKTAEVVFEVKPDGQSTGDYELEISYRLPPDVDAAGVLAFFRSQIKPGWTEASDATCVARLAQLPPPPTATVGDEGVAPMSNLPQPTLMMRRSELTLFAENESESADRPIEGLTLSLSVESGAKTLKLGPVEYSCGADTADRVADEFDAF